MAPPTPGLMWLHCPLSCFSPVRTTMKPASKCQKQENSTLTTKYRKKAERRSRFNCRYKPFTENDLQPVKALPHEVISARNEQATMLIKNLTCDDM